MQNGYTFDAHGTIAMSGLPQFDSVEAAAIVASLSAAHEARLVSLRSRFRTRSLGAACDRAEGHARYAYVEATRVRAAAAAAAAASDAAARAASLEAAADAPFATSGVEGGSATPRTPRVAITSRVATAAAARLAARGAPTAAGSAAAAAKTAVPGITQKRSVTVAGAGAGSSGRGGPCPLSTYRSGEKGSSTVQATEDAVTTPPATSRTTGRRLSGETRPYHIAPIAPLPSALSLRTPPVASLATPPRPSTANAATTRAVPLLLRRPAITTSLVTELRDCLNSPNQNGGDLTALPRRPFTSAAAVLLPSSSRPATVPSSMYAFPPESGAAYAPAVESTSLLDQRAAASLAVKALRFRFAGRRIGCAAFRAAAGGVLLYGGAARGAVATSTSRSSTNVNSSRGSEGAINTAVAASSTAVGTAVEAQMSYGAFSDCSVVSSGDEGSRKNYPSASALAAAAPIVLVLQEPPRVSAITANSGDGATLAPPSTSSEVLSSSRGVGIGDDDSNSISGGVPVSTLFPLGPALALIASRIRPKCGRQAFASVLMGKEGTALATACLWYAHDR